MLIVALVSVALLGFFPGMASDAQETQSKMYWQSASPIAITEWAAKWQVSGIGNYTQVYIRIKNTGSYPIRLRKVLANGKNASDLCTSPGWWCPVGNGYGDFTVMYLYPGDEKILAPSMYFAGVPQGTYGTDTGRFFVFEYQMPGSVSANCAPAAPYGAAVVNGFGFEYTEYIEGQQIVKQQIGAKPLVMKCN